MNYRTQLKAGGRHQVQATYDRVADEYARRISDELAGKPFDRDILDRFAALVLNAGTVCDVGCGPGHVARYLHERGVKVIGVDHSAEMIRVARELNPGLEFRHGDMRRLSLADHSLAGIVAFYSIIHLELKQLEAVFREWHRVLAPNAPLLVAFHIGKEPVHLEEWWGRTVDIDFVFFESLAVQARLVEAGFRIGEAHEREPYVDVEHPSRRAYVLANLT